jgi:hypothetical protein
MKLSPEERIELLREILDVQIALGILPGNIDAKHKGLISDIEQTEAEEKRLRLQARKRYEYLGRRKSKRVPTFPGRGHHAFSSG